MSEALNIPRPKWLKILIGIFSAWVTFISTVILQLSILWVIQIKLLDIEIEGAFAVFILIILAGISGFIAYKTTKWQSKILDKKSINVSFVVLILLILISLLIMPAPMTYIIL